MRISKLFIALPLTTAFACGADDGSFAAEDSAFESQIVDESNGDTAAAPDADPSVVASVDVGYGTVYFHEYHGEDGTTAIAVSQLAPNTYVHTPLHDTMAAHTNLEVFLALVPGQQPPQSYIDAHPGQAAELGRETSEITEARFDANAPIEKTSQACKNWITPERRPGDHCWYVNYTGIKESNNKTGVNGLTLTATRKEATLGVCNDGTHNVQGRLRWAPSNTENYNDTTWTSNLPSGYLWRWFGVRVFESCPGDFCVNPIYRNLKWRVEGRSMTTNATNTYDLRGAIIDGYVWVTPPPSGCSF